MKALLINGSPHAKGCTYTALSELKHTLEAEGIETELIHVGNQDVRGCIACGQCRKLGKCVFDDVVNEVASKLAEADAFVIGAPVYYSSPAGGATPPATAARRARAIRMRTKRARTFSPTSASGCSAIRRLQPRLRRAVGSASRVC